MSKLITLIVHNFEAPIVPYLFFGLWVVCSLLIALVAISDRMEAGKPPNVAGQLISGVVGGVFMAAIATVLLIFITSGLGRMFPHDKIFPLGTLFVSV